MITACAGEPVVPVSDLTTPKSRYAARVIQPGDTLYLLAWESGLDYRELASWNHLAPPYQLKPGGQIRLTAPSNQQGESGVTDSELQSMALTTIDSTGPIQNVVVTETVTSGSGLKKEIIPASSTIARWLWPAEGNVIQSFTGQNGNNGLDISGNEGSSVQAAARGIVVYAGSGLRGYGQLLIIQHNEEFLSAYAHNRALLVREGAIVEAGQIVAEMGSTDSDTTRLHFEIRRDGKPINPLIYLPHRSS